jgi:sulfoxide reductase heme-binding subunit YedZ
MNIYVISIVIAVLVILIAALVSNSIKFEGGSNPSDPRKRKMWFWVLMILAPVLTYILGAFVIHPDQINDPMGYDEHMQNLPIGAGISAVVYILIGFVLAKMFKNGKIGHWF